MIKPLGDKILVKRSETEAVTSGGIHIPEAAKEKPQQGMVVAVGKGNPLPDGTVVPFTVKVDDKILFAAYAGTEIDVGGVEHLIMNESEVFAVIV